MKTVRKEKFHFKRPTRRQVAKFILNSLIIVVGNAITASGAAFFIIPNGFVMGGTTGLGIFVRNLIAESVAWREYAVSMTVYAANIMLFLLGVALLGKKFAAGTLAGTLLYPSFVTLFTYLNDLYLHAHGGVPIGMGGELGSPLFTAVCGALIFGLGIGIVIRVGASTGGTDIPPLILKKFFDFPVSVSLWCIDGCIILLQFTLPNVGVNEVLYGIIISLISSIVLQKVSPIGMRRTQVKIISAHYPEIRDMILTKISRGVTVLYGQTGYLKEDCHVLLTVVSHRELVALKAEVQKIDPAAFMTISEVSEVRGNGFHSDGVDFLLPEERRYLDENGVLREGTLRQEREQEERERENHGKN